MGRKDSAREDPVRLLIGVLMLCTAWAAPVLSAEPREWGPTVNGLRMALALVDVGPGEPQVLEITIENAGGRTSVIQIGWFGETESRLTLHAGSSTGQVVVAYTREGLSKARCPFIVPLLAGARYQVRRPTGDYMVPKLNVSLGKFLLDPGPSWLRATLQVGETAEPLIPMGRSGMPEAPIQSCIDQRGVWQGTLASNTLRLPARR